MWFKPENLTARVLEFSFQHDGYEIWKTNTGTFVAYSRPSDFGIWRQESQESYSISAIIAEIAEYYIAKE